MANGRFSRGRQRKQRNLVRQQRIDAMLKTVEDISKLALLHNNPTGDATDATIRIASTS